MRDELQIKEAFGAAHAEEALLEATSASVVAKMRSRQTQSARQWTRLAAAAACALVLFCAGFGTSVFLQPVSVISIDINPSLELGVNGFDRVVSIKGFNPEGEELAENLKLKFLSSTDAVERVVTSEMVTDLLAQDEELFITVVGENADTSTALCQELENAARGVNSQCHTALLENVEEAHHCGLSYGKYLVFLAAQEENEGLTPEDVQGMTMRQLRELSGQHHGHGHHAGQETQEETTLPSETTCETQSTHGSHKQSGHNGKKHH